MVDQAVFHIELDIGAGVDVQVVDALGRVGDAPGGTAAAWAMAADPAGDLRAVAERSGLVDGHDSERGFVHLGPGEDPWGLDPRKPAGGCEFEFARVVYADAQFVIARGQVGHFRQVAGAQWFGFKDGILFPHGIEGDQFRGLGQKFGSDADERSKWLARNINVGGP